MVVLSKRETVRRALRTLRATVGLSQLAVSEQLGIPEKRYWRIENGYERLSDQALRAKLARVLNVQASELPAEHEEAKAS